MRLPRLLVLFAGLLSAAARSATPPATLPPDDRAAENLAAFARVYGYVRFFYPGDRAQEIDWNKLAVLGPESVRAAPDPAALRTALLQLFQPVAPQLRLDRAPVSLPAPAAGTRLTYWQHAGLNLTDKPNIYRQRRVLSGETQGPRAPIIATATAPMPLQVTLADQLVLTMPLALPVGATGETADPVTEELTALQGRLAILDLKTVTVADWRVRVAGIVEVWTIFQHFHPYLDQAGVDWNAALVPALRRTLRDEQGEDYYATLMEMIARTHDGHGFVYVPAKDRGGMPIRVAVIEGQVVVTGVADDAPFRKGDIIAQLDGVPGMEVLRERERYTSGSPQLREFRALNQYGAGAIGSIARVEIVRDGQPMTINFARTKDRRGYFFNPIPEFSPPAFAEVRPGIFYVNLYSLDQSGLEARIPQLAGARGVIFDWRWAGGPPLKEGMKSIQPERDILPHLIDQPIQASPMMVPLIPGPDRAGWSYQTATWPVKPGAPRLTGRVVWINEPSVVSYGETCMAMIADYHLATLVGAPTAGTNGNAGFIPLPGGYRVMWTGMDVRKHDHSSFYNAGFAPDVPVARTLAGVKAGRDEYLEQAIATIETATAPTTAK